MPKKPEIPLIHFNKWISPQRKLEIWKFSKRLLTSDTTRILYRNAKRFLSLWVIRENVIIKKTDGATQKDVKGLQDE